MGYLRDTCRRCRCGARASCELVNRHNAVVGEYCKRCGARALKQLLADEKRLDEARL